MDGGAAIGLGHHQQTRLVQEIAQIRGQPPRIAQTVEDRDAVIAQDAEAGSRDDGCRRLIPAALEIVFAVAQEGEVILGQPIEEGARFGYLVGGQRRRRFVELRRHIGDLGPHGTPIGDRGADIGQHMFQIAADFLQLVAAGLLVDAHLHEGFVARLAPLGVGVRHVAAGVAGHLDDGMDDEMNGQIVAGQFRGD